MRPMARLVGVRKSFSRHEVLKGIDLRVESGEVHGLIGPSGSGKSTLLRTINALERIDAGRVEVGGELVGCERVGDRIREAKDADIVRQRAKVGMVFQRFNLFPHLSVLDNITMAPVLVKREKAELARAHACELLARVGLTEKRDAIPQQLSGGQQQRVAIARALAMRPALMLFDEPTSALDPELVGEVLDIIRDLAGDGVTMIIVTHEIGFAAQICDAVTFIEDGRIVESGPPRQVLTDPTNPRTRTFLRQVR